MKSITKYLSEYLSSKVVFALDILISLVSAFIVLLILNFMSGSNYYGGTFALWWLGGTVVFSALTMMFCKSYKVIIRHMTITDIKRYLIGILFSDILLGVLLSITYPVNGDVLIALVFDFFLTVILILGVRFVMLDVYKYYSNRLKEDAGRQRILVYGTSDKSVSTISRFSNSRHFHLIGFITRDTHRIDLQLANYPVMSFQSENEFKSIIQNHSINAILFTSDTDAKAEASDLIRYCTNSNIKTLITPTVDEFVGGKVKSDNIRHVKIEDLLGRQEIKISLKEIKDNFKDKVILVTGAAGSIGSELCRQLAYFGVKQLVLYDNAETPMHNLRLELESRFPELNFVPVIGSVRHKNRLDYAFRKWQPEVVFHAAAYKHVPLMEENPCEAVFANVYGSRMVADKCVQYGVDMMVMISTDKAVNPTNIMGCSKRLAEIYVQSLGLALARGEIEGKTKFVTTRFGNVLGSNGSVIPLFREQIENGGPVTVTHPDITRFFMTIPEACRLVMEAATLSEGNQIFVFDMGESVKITDLAKRMIELAGLKLEEDIRIEYTGLRPGEKLYEEVLANAENTIPTTHDRIRIAKVREYNYSEVVAAMDELAAYSRSVNIPDMVKLMKRIVPEFKSQNSRFEEYDKAE